MTQRKIDNTLASLLRESLRRPRATRAPVEVTSPDEAQMVMREVLRASRVRTVVKPVERGMFSGERVSLPGDDVVRLEVRVAAAQHRRGFVPPAQIRAEARGAIRVAQVYLGASREVVDEALEEIARLV